MAQIRGYNQKTGKKPMTTRNLSKMITVKREARKNWPEGSMN
jgi:hypothetical protein